MPDKIKTLIAVMGPTAVGKTALGILLAKHFQTEILSADSRQFYREMSIGTAKPNQQDLAAAKHHFIDSHSIVDKVNVGDFEQKGLEVLNQIFQEHATAIMVGGSGLYVKAICEGFDDLPLVESGIRIRLNDELAQEGIGFLQEKLKHADPVYYQKVDLQNPQRIIRALEVFESTGKPFSAFHNRMKNPRAFHILKIGLNMPRDILYERINQRVNHMLEQGLVEEVKSLVPYKHLNALNTVGYSEIFAFLDNQVDYETAVAMIKQNTRRFAKRQLTWFRRDSDIHWFGVDQDEAILQLIDKSIQS